MPIDAIKMEQKIYRAYQGLKGKYNSDAIQKSSQELQDFLREGLQNPAIAKKSHIKALWQTMDEINDSNQFKKVKTFKDALHNCFIVPPKRIFQKLRFSTRLDQVTYNGRNGELLEELNKAFDSQYPKAKERKAVRKKAYQEAYQELNSGKTIQI